MDSIHYYDSILVIEKKLRPKPYDEQIGIPSFEIPKELEERPEEAQRMSSKVRDNNIGGFLKRLFGGGKNG